MLPNAVRQGTPWDLAPKKMETLDSCNWRTHHRKSHLGNSFQLVKTGTPIMCPKNDATLIRSFNSFNHIGNLPWNAGDCILPMNSRGWNWWNHQTERWKTRLMQTDITWEIHTLYANGKDSSWFCRLHTVNHSAYVFAIFVNLNRRRRQKIQKHRAGLYKKHLQDGASQL